MARHRASFQLIGPSSSKLLERRSTSRLQHKQTHTHTINAWSIALKRSKKPSYTHSQNSMTEEVAFSGMLLSMVVWLWRSNTTHASAGEHTAGCTQRTQNDTHFFVFAVFTDLCSTCCCSATRAAPPGSCRRGRRGPRPGWRCSKHSHAGSSPGWHSPDLQRHHHSLCYEFSAEMQYYICTVLYFKDLYFDMFYKCSCDRLYVIVMYACPWDCRGKSSTLWILLLQKRYDSSFWVIHRKYIVGIFNLQAIHATAQTYRYRVRLFTQADRIVSWCAAHLHK